MSREHYEASQRLMGRHRTDLRPVLENPAAAWRRIELCWPRATGRTPAGTLMVGIQNLVYTARQSTGVRATLGNRNVFRSVIRIVFRSTCAGTGRPFTTARVNCQVPDSRS